MRWGTADIRAAAIEKCFADLLSESSYSFESGSVQKAVLNSGCLIDSDGIMPILVGSIAEFISFEVTPGESYTSSGSLIDYAVSQFYQGRRRSSGCFSLRLKLGAQEVPLLAGGLVLVAGRETPKSSSFFESYRDFD